MTTPATTPTPATPATPASALREPAAPTLNGQVIGQAERATRAVLEIVLARTCTPFNEWVAINLLGSTSADADPDPAMTIESLVERLTVGLRIDRHDATAAVDGARTSGLIEGSTELRLTDRGQARFGEISAAITEIAARLYGGLPHADLAVARRVLETVTARARAELAA